MMMVVPVNAQKYKTKQVAQKHGNQWHQGSGICFVRWSQLQHHNGDDDGNHTIAKCFHASLSHWLVFVVDTLIALAAIHIIDPLFARDSNKRRHNLRIKLLSCSSS